MTGIELHLFSESINRSFPFSNPLVSDSQQCSLMPDQINISTTNNIDSSNDFKNNNTLVSDQDKSNESSNQNSSENKKRKYFTEEEDQLLIAAAISYNQSSWNTISQCIPGKTSKQCRDRWMNYLRPSLKFDPWTNQEDSLLISLVNIHGTHWTKMKQYFPGRSTNSIKNRWYWLIKNKVGIFQIDNFKGQMIQESNDIFTQHINNNISHSNDNIFDIHIDTNVSNENNNQNKKFYYLLNHNGTRKKSKSKKSNDKNFSKLNKSNINFEKQGISINKNSFESLKSPPIFQESINSFFGADDLMW